MFLFNEHTLKTNIGFDGAVVLRAEFDAMQREAAFSRSFLCVPKAPLLQTVWGAEMVAGVGCGGGGEGRRAA